ncbi:glycerate kinase [Thermoplasma sp. Kam2015]|uniref:glycerate kinase type-2 family protein n=1 Tax=Thermoplasma sp. Kam2015 TaxID=2094122 RepID=UPI000D9F5E2E|nr:glycerate kinase [Thermoplasma sp. Kam2015]PYB68725.1 glycerate kinase [Thermoplasma sp. Kam2015]
MAFTFKNAREIYTSERRQFILDILKRTFDELDPSRVMASAVEDLDISKYSRIFVMGFGKASYEMYAGIRDHVKSKLAYAGIIVPVDQDVQGFPELEVLRGTHPYTSNMSVSSSRVLLSKIKPGPDDLVIVLISGGGSSLFEIPEDGITIEQISEISKRMMQASADIYELNTIRSCLSSVKGGKLAKFLYPASIAAYIISDVPGDDVSIIASGPLSENKLDPVSVYQKFKDVIGLNIDRFLKTSMIEDEYFRKIQTKIVLSNRDFVRKIEAYVGEPIVSIGSGISGDVDHVSDSIIAIAEAISKIKGKSFWMVMGGETTVNVRGKGIGGRNLEISLLFLKKCTFSDFLFISIGTDGIDGVSPAAGGIVDSSLKKRISEDEIDEALKNNDSYTLLSKYGSAIMTGRTGNNVSDLMIAYVSI